MMPGPLQDEPVSLSVRLVGYYREALRVHTNDAVLGVCPICQIDRCQDWRFAWERLVCAGERPEAEEAACRPAQGEDSHQPKPDDERS
jgi:hypothetical protein